MRAIRWMAVGAALIAGPAFAQQTGQTTPTPRAQQPGTTAQAEIDRSEWIAESLLVNKWAIETSEIAAKQAATAQTRKFAQQAVQTHQKLQERLEQIAEREGVDVRQALEQQESAKRELMHDALVTSLRALPQMNGVNLDRVYLTSMVLGHDLAINKVNWALTQVQNPQLTQAARDVLNTMVEHRREAWQLLGSKQIAPQVQRGQARRAPPAER